MKSVLAFAACLILASAGSSASAQEKYDAQWMWFDAGNPAQSAPAGKVWFRREVRAFEPSTGAARILCDNALKYSPQGEPIVLRAFFDEQGAPCFSVQDHGQGISSADIPHIFERFYRADPARARNSGGTGLGLSIAKWIVDRHGGYFRVISREEVGTRMVVCLPGAQAHASVTS